VDFEKNGMTDSIVKLNVGGQIFVTKISTLTKYPDSMLALMFNHTDEGMSPMAKTKDGAYFLDANPVYFGEILEYLRHGEISTEDSNLWKGIAKLANHFGLTDLALELERNNDWVILDLERKKKVEISKRTLTRFKSTTLAKYFLGEEEAKIELSQWIKKESGNCYYIGRPWKTIENMLNFLQEVNPGIDYKIDEYTAGVFEREMELFGFGRAAKKEDKRERNSQLFVDNTNNNSGKFCWKKPEHIKV